MWLSLVWAGFDRLPSSHGRQMFLVRFQGCGSDFGTDFDSDLDSAPAICVKVYEWHENSQLLLHSQVVNKYACQKVRAFKK